MGEKKRREAAEVLVVARDEIGPRDLPPGDVDMLACEIAGKGDPVSRAVQTADWVSIAARTKPGAVLSLSVSGFDDDPREVPDIPEAAALFKAFGERLVALDCVEGGQLLFQRLDAISRTIMLVCMGIVPRSEVRIVEYTEADWTQRLQEDVENARLAEALHQPPVGEA